MTSLANKSLHHQLRGMRIALPPPLLLPPHLLRSLRSLPDRSLLVLGAVQITSLTLTTPPATRPEVLAEMSVAFFARHLLAADVAHSVPAIANQLVTAAGLDEAEQAARTRAFHGCGRRGLDSGAEGCLLAFEADVRVPPGGCAAYAGYLTAGRIAALELQPATLLVDS